MAFNTHDVRFFFYCLRQGVSFKKTLVIGRTQVWVKAKELFEIAREFGVDLSIRSADDILKRKNGYCEPLFELLGAEQVLSMDISNYEEAELIHDLNRPLPNSFQERFTAVVDGGSLEHVFNIVEAFKSCMELTAEAGSFISLTVANNFLGHGFHQLSPEFLFGALNSENGFIVKRVFMHENKKYAPIFEVVDPRHFGGRVVLCNRLPVFIKAWAVREKVKPLFETFPQQPDWQDLWQKKESCDQELSLKTKIRNIVQKIRPELYSEYLRIRIENSQETGFKSECYRKISY